MSHWQMYLKPKYVQDDAVWVDRGAEQPVKGQKFALHGPQNVRGGAKQAGCESDPRAGNVPTYQGERGAD